MTEKAPSVIRREGTERLANPEKRWPGWRDKWGPEYVSQTPQEKYRRSQEKYKIITLRVERDQAEALMVFSKKTGQTQAELIRTYIEWGLENDGGEND